MSINATTAVCHARSSPITLGAGEVGGRPGHTATQGHRAGLPLLDNGRTWLSLFGSHSIAAKEQHGDPRLQTVDGGYAQGGSARSVRACSPLVEAKALSDRGQASTSLVISPEWSSQPRANPVQ